VPSVLAVLLALLLTADAAPAPATTPLALADGGAFAPPEGAASLGEAAGVTTDALGRVWATDAAGNRLLRWDASGRWRDEFGSLGSDANQFRRPTALARLGSLGVAVLDAENRRLVAYDLMGRLTDLVVALDASDLEASVGRVTPIDLASDRGGALYVAESDRDRVLAFDFSGKFVRAIGGYGLAPGAFHGIAAVAVAPRGELVVLERPVAARRRGKAAADSTRAGAPARLQWLDASGAPLSAWNLPDEGARDFALAVDDSGRVAVALSGGRADRVRLYSREGVLLAESGDVATPRALAFAADGALLVAEAGAGRVRRLLPVPAGGR